MNLKSLQKTKRSLEAVLSELEQCHLRDHAIRHRYAEFVVAYELRKMGHAIQILDDRDERGADIYLTDSKKWIEVKSSKSDEDDWAYASFGMGNQIAEEKFDYCVVITFPHEHESIKKKYIFKLSELK